MDLAVLEVPAVGADPGALAAVLAHLRFRLAETAAVTSDGMIEHATVPRSCDRNRAHAKSSLPHAVSGIPNVQFLESQLGPLE